jgi:FAD/FMN-containing dehydrogenase
MSTQTSIADAARAKLGSAFAGELTGPGDATYDEGRSVFNAMIDRRPALIARPADAGAVAALVGFARAHDLPIAVRGGGHNGGGLGVCDDGVVIDLSRIAGVDVDPATRSVRVGGGATWGAVDAATNPHGLATPSGIISTTGVGGLTLGGGIGHLSRAHGLTIDNLLEAEVVLAGGEIVRAAPDENEDLFWALRGGGGNFGVVTSFRFRCNPVGNVLAGPTFWSLDRSAEMMRWYRDFQPALPRELTGFFAFLTVPPVAPFPEPLHMQKVCGVVWCYTGDPAAADELFAPVLATEPLMHGVGEMPFPAIQSAFDGLYPKGDQWYWRADFVRELPDAAIAAHVEHGTNLPTWKSTMHLYPIDGAVHDVGAADTAFAFRDVRWAEVIVGVDADPANAGLIRQWTVDYWDATHPHSAGGAYVNFMMDEGQERVQATYGQNYTRLTRVKAAYDPDNVFRVNQNIQPAAG